MTKDTSKLILLQTAILDGNGYYTTYQEGIYVGYRYYETRYEDVVMGTQRHVGEVRLRLHRGLSLWLRHELHFDWSN